MSLLDTLRLAVKTADSVTKAVQSTVVFQKAVADSSGYGAWTYPTSVNLRAIVDWKQHQVRTLSGVLSMCRATVMFLDAAALATATSSQGIKDVDRIFLPDGSTGPILNMAGFIDAGTEKPLATEVYLG